FAASVAVLGLATSPQLALLAGNILAFVFGQRRGIGLTFKSKRLLAVDIYEFTFALRKKLRFIPGQYIEISLPNDLKTDARGERRMFSIVSTPADDELRLAMHL